jgi:hypothetical protein
MKSIDLSKYKIIGEHKGDIAAMYRTDDPDGAAPRDLLLMWKTTSRVEFTELKKGKEEDSLIRIWPNNSGFEIQFRTTQPLGENGRFSKGKPRNLIATAHISIHELGLIANYLKNYHDEK